MNRSVPSQRESAFTLVELLIVISIIGVIAGMVISSYSNAAQDSRRVVALQQQVEVQGALNNWIAAQDSLAGARIAYANKTNAERLTLVKAYLDNTTLAQFDGDGNGAFDTDASGRLVSVVMAKVGQSISLMDWADDSYPEVRIYP